MTFGLQVNKSIQKKERIFYEQGIHDYGKQGIHDYGKQAIEYITYMNKSYHEIYFKLNKPANSLNLNQNNLNQNNSNENNSNETNLIPRKDERNKTSNMNMVRSREDRGARKVSKMSNPGRQVKSSEIIGNYI